MDLDYDLITGDVQPGDEIVLNTDGTVDVDAWVDRLKKGGFKVIEEGGGAVVLRLAGDESKDGFGIPPRDNLRVDGDSETRPSISAEFWFGESDLDILWYDDDPDDAPAWLTADHDDASEYHSEEEELPADASQVFPRKEEKHKRRIENWITELEDVKVQNKETLKITIDKRKDQECLAALFFKPAHCNRGSDSSSSSKIELRLKLDQLCFGVKNSVLEKDELGAFIHEIEILVEPSPSWSPNCDRLKDVVPAPDPPVFQTQVGSAVSAVVTLGASPTGAVGYQRDRLVSVHSPAFRWLPAESNWSKKSVTWRWKMYTWDDGTPFTVDRSSSFASRGGTGDFRKLPFLGDMNYSSGSTPSFVAEATWEVPADAIRDGESIRWVIKVKMHTSHVRRIILIPPNLALKCRVTKGLFQFDSEVESGQIFKRT